MARALFLLSMTPWHDRRPFHRQAPALVAAGHHVLYAAAPPDREVEHPFEWVPLSERERALARRTGGLNLFRRISSLRPDIVQLCSLELLPLGLALKAARRTKVVYDCREDIASAQRERRRNLPQWARSLLFRAVRALEGAAARRFDAIVTADPAVWELHSGMPAERKHVFYNTGLLSHFPSGYPDLANREFDLAVLGSMSSARSGTHLVLDAMGLLKERGRAVSLLLIGQPEGDVVGEIQDRIELHGLSDAVEITGRIPHERVASQLVRARIGIVPLLDYPKFHKNIACKAFEYMACGMPTIASDLPPQHIFLHADNARFFESGDAEGLAACIEELLSDMHLCTRMGEHARREVEERWNAEREQVSLQAFYGAILSMPAR
jgi:glycosyltransferase involved in cell wall biosynthesis